MLARPDPNNTSVPALQCRLLRATLFLDTPGEICYKPKGQGRPGASWIRLALEDREPCSMRVEGMLSEVQLKQLAQEVTRRGDPLEALEETLRSYIAHKLSHYGQEILRLEWSQGTTPWRADGKSVD